MQATALYSLLHASSDKRIVTDCKRSLCPVSCFLDIVGDNWTLLVVRDLLLGKHTFKEFQASPENIPSNILADRLKRLEREVVITRQPYQKRPKHYAYYLSNKGKDLGKVMRSMVAWANKHIPDTYDMQSSKGMLSK